MNNNTQELTKTERCKQWYQSCKAEQNAKHKTRLRSKYKNDPTYRINVLITERIYTTIKRAGGKRCAKITDLLGCTHEEFAQHLQSLWQPGMSWDNHGKHGWHIDHIKPCNTFDLTDPEQQKQCFHYSNVRPLWAKINWSRPKDGSDL